MQIEKRNNNQKNMNSNGDKSIGKIASFFLFKNLIEGYENDKNTSDEERQKIKKYGILSLVLGGIALIISASCLFSSLGNEYIGVSRTLLIFVYIVGGVIISLLLAVYGFIFGLMQMRLNRKMVGLFGLILSILSGVASILLICFMFI